MPAQSQQCLLSGPALTKARRKMRFNYGSTSSSSFVETLSDPVRAPDVRRPSKQSNGIHHIDQDDVVVACKAFIDAFPELSFLHLPTVVAWLSEIANLDLIALQGAQSIHLLLASVITVHASMTRGASGLPLTDPTISHIRS